MIVSTTLRPVTPGAMVPVIVKYIVDQDITALLVMDIAPVSITVSGLSQALPNQPHVPHAAITVHATWFPGWISEPLIYPVEDAVHHIVDNKVLPLLYTCIRYQVTEFPEQS